MRHTSGPGTAAALGARILILLTTAATTLAAALQAPAWVTAGLGAIALTFVGLRRIFDWHENRLSFSSARAKLGRTIHAYRLLPEERRSEAAKSALVVQVDDIVMAETTAWTEHRRTMRDGEQTP
ncbi:SLATT domain-containing protein [Nonomuraea polychroma]|uniref:SLATT domain-containing protein n=1 Tax=Nonomuraea polychroma TaxID=46176 RepID=UPI0013E3A90D|nr:SLATT domain-containing protein [Nonomuraea polychroma]